MAVMRSGNPILNEKTFARYTADQREGNMSVQGTVNKTGILLFLVLLGASYTWNKFFEYGDPSAISGYLMGGILVGFIACMVAIFAPTFAWIAAPVYAVAEGLALGGISSVLEMRYPGLVIQAVGLTFGTMFALLVAYKTRVIRATENFKMGIFAATGGIAIVYLASMILGFFGVNVPFIHESGLFGIGFSVFVVVIAALNLVLDFDFIEQASAQGAPKFMEWRGALGLVITLVWLYMEILRLLAKLNSRRN